MLWEASARMGVCQNISRLPAEVNKKKVLFLKFLSIFRLFCDSLKAKHLTGTHECDRGAISQLLPFIVKTFLFLLSCAMIMIKDHH